ncbi:MAG: SurA N-terminal domain-containing protein [Candidatus Nanopelagicales bacterium]
MSVKRWIPVLLIAGLGLVGCGPTLSGSAAVVGEQRLTDADLSDTTSQLTEKLGIPESAQVSQAILSRWVVSALVDELAARKNIDVTQGAVDSAIADETKNAGGTDALEQGALQSGVLPDQIPDAVRTSLLIEEMSKYTITGDDPSGQSGLLVQVQQLAEEMRPEISPRFGTWDPQQLSVGALPDDLSSPVGSAADPLAQLQQQQ